MDNSTQLVTEKLRPLSLIDEPSIADQTIRSKQFFFAQKAKAIKYSIQSGLSQ